MLIRIFTTFIALGFSSFGGGYVLLSMLEHELVEKLGWITKDQFILTLAAAQVSPGPVAIAGVFAGFLTGYNYYHNIPMAIFCSFLAWIGANISVPICMGLLMKLYDRISCSPIMDYICLFLMPIIIGIILYLGAKMGVNSMVTVPQVFIAIVAFILAWSKKVDFAIIIIGGAVIGYLFLRT